MKSNANRIAKKYLGCLANGFNKCSFYKRVLVQQINCEGEQHKLRRNVSVEGV